MQETVNEMSFAPYPQKINSFYQREFCGVASHLRQETCSTRPRRRIRMDQDQPNLCLILEAFDEYFNGSMSCKYWPENFFKHHDKRNETLEHEMYQYAKENLAKIEVMIQSPYVTMIKRDVAMTLVNYVAKCW